MKTWNDYKEHVKNVDPDLSKDIHETEEIAAVVSAMVQQKNKLGLSQRELAQMCGIPQSSVARIESGKITPNLGTLLKISRNLDVMGIETYEDVKGRFELYSRIYEGMQDVENGRTRPVSEVFADLRKKRKR